MARLPNPGSDDGVWGDILNEFLAQVHNTDGTLKDDVITEDKLDSAARIKLNAVAGTPDWTTLTNVPAVVAAGSTQAAAKATLGLTKSDVGLGNVDNTSDATKNAATVTLTNKTIALGSNTVSGTTAQFNTALTDGDFATLAGTEALTNKTINASSNTISNLTVTHFAASAVITEAEGIGSNDNDTTLPTSAAVKDYVDNNAGGGGDASTNTAASVVNEIALFADTSGKVLKRASGSGIATINAGVLGAVTAPSGNIVGTTDAQTLSNKRVQPRSGSVSSSATPAINSDAVDTFQITSLATNITSMTSGLTGTPVIGQQLLISIKDNGSARTIAWGASYVSTGAATLPSTTSAGSTHWVGLVWDGSRWACLAADAIGY